MQILVITDLDGTLMDEQTYAIEPAGEFVRELISNGIPVIPCTSKTRAEVEWICSHLLNISPPMIVENGSAVLIPPHPTPPLPLLHIIEPVQKVFGLSYAEIRHRFEKLRRKMGWNLIGFGDLSIDAIIRHTGLSEDVARRAAKREYSEPVLRNPEVDPDLFDRQARSYGMRVLEGNRFYHLIGTGADKGVAVEWFRSLFETPSRKELLIIGLGDSPNDVDLLKSVDIPVIIPRSRSGQPDPALMHLPGARIAPHPGPRGWVEALRKLIPEVIHDGHPPVFNRPS